MQGPRDPRLNGQDIEKHFVPRNKVMFLVLRTNFMVVSLGVHPKPVCQTEVPPLLKAQI